MITTRYFTIITSILAICIAYFFLAFNPNQLVTLKSAFPFIESTFFKQSISNSAANLKQVQGEMAESASNENWKTAKSIYEFKAHDINGELIDLSKYQYVLWIYFLYH